MRYKVARLFHFVHSLLEPVLCRYDVFKVIPLRDDDLSKLTKVRETQQIGFLTFKPRIFQSSRAATLRVLLNL
ncbi:hypothetical protein ABIF29_003352 [Bradyrhizobium elkanii]|uniref:Uncharacterized protein n=1 Tax=Bradyrhizobium elkanii TaxID=29448 RepID=A0ABV4EZF7_BRAEL|nr:hypothetical protein [Bradyrhizobium elkanii]MCP1983087.1 hypothetical protein [Bradyrhizobium elkanii]MCS3691476.1 hypothetical protein [Bradyrhizobium elkanii]MCS3882130.1 hypothetical protein [Bradyrhizobium elkanii]MCS4218890.1 hypothetical protein [Bradyrhizobium elkanii]